MKKKKRQSVMTETESTEQTERHSLSRSLLSDMDDQFSELARNPDV